MKLDLSKEPRRLAGYDTSDLTDRQKATVPTGADWLAMIRALDLHIDLYCASTGIERHDAYELIAEKLERYAASIPDALAVVQRERARLDAEWDAEMAALSIHWPSPPDRRKAGADRRASA